MTALEKRLCAWKEIVEQRGSTMDNANKKLLICRDRCNGYGLIDQAYDCQTYYNLVARVKE